MQTQKDKDMREKTLKLVITFHTTTDAMAMEKACKSQGIPGRLIPIPQEISAVCGLARCAQLDQKEDLLVFMKREGLEMEAVAECMLS